MQIHLSKLEKAGDLGIMSLEEERFNLFKKSFVYQVSKAK